MIFIFGTLLGNFATTVLYRLPRGIILSGFNKKLTKPPFCSNCAHPLKFYEYLPVLSWISTFGTCNYCKMPITLSYFLLEVSAGIFAVLCVILYGHNIENYIIMFCFYVTGMLAFFIKYKHGIVPKVITASLVFEGILYRTLNDQSILPWLIALSFASVLSLYIFKDKLYNVKSQELVHIILPTSIWLQASGLIIFILLVLPVFFINRMCLAKINFYNISIILLMLMVLGKTGILF